MPFDQSEIRARPRPGLRRDEEGSGLSRRLAHIGVQQLARLIRRGAEVIYSRASGLSDFEWRILARVCDAPGMSINELGAIMDRGVPQVSRTVKRLVGMGLLRRENVGGGPGVAVSPTAAGLEAYAPLVKLAEEGERELTAGLTDSELKALHHIIKVMTDNALARLARAQELQARDGQDVGS